MKKTPARRTASRASSVRGRSTESDFSHSTGFPACAASTTYSWCRWLGSAMYTASTCGSRISSAYSEKLSGTPNFCWKAARVCGVRPATACTHAAGCPSTRSRAMAETIISEMKLVPRTPHLSTGNNRPLSLGSCRPSAVKRVVGQQRGVAVPHAVFGLEPAYDLAVSAEASRGDPGHPFRNGNARSGRDIGVITLPDLGWSLGHYSSAPSRSSSRSEISSMPTEKRSSPGVMPSLWRSSSERARWLVLQG